MRYATRIQIDERPELAQEGVRAFFLGEGYSEREVSGDVISFEKKAGLRAAMSSRIEKLPVVVEVKPGMTDESSRRQQSVFVRYDCRPFLRVLTRIDRQYFRLEAENLGHYLATGTRRELQRRLDRLRRPVNQAMIFNVITTTVLVAVAGRVAGFNLGLIIAAAIVVGMLNAIAIIGFADIVVEAMEEL
ncbi:MAG: hypothetical protein V3W41_06930 [Planctomycetota bacterium]